MNTIYSIIPGICNVKEKYSTHTVKINTVNNCITVNEITVLIL